MNSQDGMNLLGVASRKPIEVAVLAGAVSGVSRRFFMTCPA